MLDQLGFVLGSDPLTQPKPDLASNWTRLRLSQTDLTDPSQVRPELTRLTQSWLISKWLTDLARLGSNSYNSNSDSISGSFVDRFEFHLKCWMCDWVPEILRKAHDNWIADSTFTSLLVRYCSCSRRTVLRALILNPTWAQFETIFLHLILLLFRTLCVIFNSLVWVLLWGFFEDFCV